jgi:hypothetical protein
MDNEYRNSAQGTSVVYSNQLWNFVSVVFVLYAGTRLDVSASRQMVHLSVDQFDMLHYAGMSVYKLGILLLNLVPYIALCICHRNVRERGFDKNARV